MKKSIIIISLFYCLSSFGQSSTPCDILRGASISYCNKEYLSALQLLLKFRKNLPNHALIEEVNQQIGHLYYLTGDFNNAKIELNKVIQGQNTGRDNDEYKALECPSTYNESIKDTTISYCMRIVFPEEYKHLQHFACIDLFKIYKEEKNFNEALKYLEFADKKYFYNTYCGNGNQMHSIQMKLYYNELLLSKSDTTSAIKELVKDLFNEEIEIIKTLKVLLTKKYSRSEIEAEINQSINNIRKIKKTSNEQEYFWIEMTLFGQSIDIPPKYMVSQETNNIEIVKIDLSKDYFLNYLRK